MNQNFYSIGINDESFKGEGIFYKSGKELLIEIDSRILSSQFIKLMKAGKKIKSISFFGSEDREYHYAGDFVISRIVDNEVTLYKP